MLFGYFITKINPKIPVNSLSCSFLHRKRKKYIISNGNMSKLSEESAIHQEPLPYKDSYFLRAKKTYLKYAVSYNGTVVCRSNAKYAN